MFQYVVHLPFAPALAGIANLGIKKHAFNNWFPQHPLKGDDDW
jgi:hypothetical protein